jgi:hypothetical protein
MSAHAMRAILFANATTTTMRGRRAIMPCTHVWMAPGLQEQWMTI